MRPISGLSSCAARSRMDDALAALLVASPGSGPPGSPNLSSRFSAAPLGRQPLQHRDLLGVGTITRAGHLEDEREVREARLVKQGAEAALADLSVSNVRVTVSIGPQPGDGIIAVDDLDSRQTDDPLQLVERLRHVGRCALVVS